MLLAYPYAAFVRYRAAVRRVKAARTAANAEGESRYLGASAESTDDVFVMPADDALPAAAVSVEQETAAPHPQVYDFETPRVQAAQPPPWPPRPGESPAEPSATVAQVPSARQVAPEPAAENGRAAEETAQSVSDSAPPTPAAPSGYSLADELERLAVAAETPSPLLTAAEHANFVSPLTAQEEIEPPFKIPSEPLPALSIGQVLSVAPAPESTPEAPLAGDSFAGRASGFESAEVPESTPEDAPPRGLDIPEHVLVSSVELHFTEGIGRIGVKPGTRSFAEFQRLAGILLADLRSARGW
jgi:hypothetical protein